MSWVESCHRETDKMWYSSFVKPSVRPGSQYDAGTVNVTNVVSIEGKICMSPWSNTILNI